MYTEYNIEISFICKKSFPDFPYFPCFSRLKLNYFALDKKAPVVYAGGRKSRLVAVKELIG